MILLDNFLLYFGYFVLFGIIAIFFIEILDNHKDIGDRILKRLFVGGASLFQGYFAVILLASIMMEIDNYVTQITNIPINYANYTLLIGVFGALFYIIYMDKYFLFKQSFQITSNKSSQRKQIICDDLEQFVHSIKKDKEVIFLEYTDKVDSYGAQISLVSNPIEICLGKDLNERTTLSEKRFVIAHEMSHSLNFIRNLTIYLIIISIFLIIIGDSHLINLENAIFIGIFQILIFFILVSFVHYHLWKEEYRADTEGVKMTDDTQSAIDFFTRTLSYEKEIRGNEQEEDFGYFNLFLFDHPLITNRIEKIQLSSK